MKDPESAGKTYLTNKISQVRGLLNEVSVFYTEALTNQYHLQTHLDDLEAAYAVEADNLLANDERVSPHKLPAIDERKAMVNVILSSKRKAIQQASKKVKAATYLEKAIKHRQKELEGTMSAIRLQKGLIEASLASQRFLGGNNPREQGIDPGLSTAELNQLFDEEPKEEEEEEETSASEEGSAEPAPMGILFDGGPAPEVAPTAEFGSSTTIHEAPNSIELADLLGEHLILEHKPKARRPEPEEAFDLSDLGLEEETVDLSAAMADFIVDNREKALIADLGSVFDKS